MEDALYSFCYQSVSYSSESSADLVSWQGTIQSDIGIEMSLISAEADVTLCSVWRALVQSQAGLAHHLQSVSSQFSERFFSYNNEGLDALAAKDREKVLSSFSQCRAMVKEELNMDDDVKTYNWLLAWADHSLALFYQAHRGDSAMLKSAMTMRMEILECVFPFLGSHPTLVKVCRSYCYTSQYEWAASEVEGKTELAVQEFAELMGYDEHEAEPHLCLLLYVDHYFTGSFEVSLRWIREAKRLWQELSPDGGGNWSFFCLECEAKLLLKLGRFPEAVKVLENSSYTNSHRAAKVHLWLHECYSQMARRDLVEGNLQQAQSHEESADLHRALQHSLCPDIKEIDTSSTIPSTPFLRSSPEGASFLAMIKAAPFAVGSSLGLVQADRDDLDLHLQKLPKIIHAIFQMQIEMAQSAIKASKYEKATAAYQIMRELLRLSMNIIDRETHAWILTWVDLPLANLYHYREQKCGKAVGVWKEILNCASNLLQPDQFLASHYSSMLDVAEYELECSQAGKREIVMKWAKTHSNEKAAECALCFWLYFGYYHHGHLEDSLRWLREAKRQDTLMCSSDGYFCCEYDYLRCEAELLMKLKRFDEAADSLKTLLDTRHYQQGSSRLAIEALLWLQACRERSATVADNEELADLQNALTCSLNINHQGGDLADRLPSPTTSPTGCLAVAHTEQLVQSEIGLEHYLHNLPPPICLAFRKHSEAGRFSYDSANWDGAIFQFEFCRELLRLFMRKELGRNETSSHDWLLVWIDVPLALLYEFQKKRMKRAFDIRTEMSVIIKREIPCITTDAEKAMRHIVFMFLYCAMYQCAVLEYPNAKGLVVKFNGGVERVDDFTSEVRMLRRIVCRHFNSGNFEHSLHFIGEGKRLLQEGHMSSSFPERDDSEVEFLCWEAACLMYLGRPQKAEKVLDEWSGDKRWDDLPSAVQYMMDCCRGKRGMERYAIEEEKLKASASDQEPSKSSLLLQLRCDSIDREKEGKYEEAVECHKKCLKMISDHKGLNATMDFGHKIRFYDYSRLALLHKRIFRRRIIPFFPGGSVTERSTAALEQDADFASAAKYYEKCIELSLALTDPVTVAKMNYELVHLYGIFHGAYLNYLMHRYTQLEAQLSSADSESDDLNSFHAEIVSYLNIQTPIEMYGRRASAQYANILYRTESPRFTEGWLQMLDGHEELYSILQQFNYGRTLLYRIVERFLDEDYDKIINVLTWRALMYAERERTRVMLYQVVASNGLLHYDALHQMRRFDVDDDLAVKTLQEWCAPPDRNSHQDLLGEDSIFVQYSRMTGGSAYLIYVIDQDRKLSIIHTGARAGEHRNDGPEDSLKKVLNRLYAYLEPKRQPKGRRLVAPYNDELMNQDLEFLHDILIAPIAHHLNKMKPEHKLLLAPSKLLSKVPFAALRDRTGPPGKRFLIERHTIAFTPSLRVLQSCSDRLRELRRSPLHPGRGAIIALGNPEYGGKQKPLLASQGEVDHIVSSFGKERVVELLGEDASAHRLMHWVAQPSQSTSATRQAFIHIGAHGKLDETNHEKSVVLLACASNTGDVTSNDDSNFNRAREDDYIEWENEIQDEEDTTEITETTETLIENRMLDLAASEFSIFRNVANSVQFQSVASSSAHYNTFHDSFNLKVKDISRSETKWRAELVVLSACRTSVGKLSSAEGVLSLARAFIIAGVPCVVASQWNVLDEATRDLMILFYDHLRNGEDVASALRSAMLDVVMRGRPVQEWAPFVSWGLLSVSLDPSLKLQKGKGSMSG